MREIYEAIGLSAKAQRLSRDSLYRRERERVWCGVGHSNWAARKQRLLSTSSQAPPRRASWWWWYRQGTILLYIISSLVAECGCGAGSGRSSCRGGRRSSRELGWHRMRPMDQFSHDLTVALEETSLLDRARASRWGQERRRTRSTGNLPCAPQPTEDSSSPTDVAHGTTGHPTTNNVDGLDTQNIVIPSDSDDKEEAAQALRLPCKPSNASLRLGTLESDSLNETFSPARFFKPNSRRKRKLKRISMDYEMSTAPPHEFLESSSALLAGGGVSTGSGTVRKRLLKSDAAGRSQLFFCGKRKRSNRDRYHEHDHSFSMPRQNNAEDFRMRPRSFSSTSKPHSDRLLPLNKGLLSKIERISQQQKTETTFNDAPVAAGGAERAAVNKVIALPDVASPDITEVVPQTQYEQQTQLPKHLPETNFHVHRKKSGEAGSGRSNHSRRRTLQFAVDQHSMDCGELNDFSSSSLSSSESDDAHTANDTDREGDDELTDWPGNESCSAEAKYDAKRKLTKKSTLPQIKSDPESVNAMLMAEDDTLMSGSGAGCGDWSPTVDINDSLELRYQSSEPITIGARSGFPALCRGINDIQSDMTIPLKQIESEMSGETSNPFLSSPPCQPNEVREIRAGCRRVKGERPGFSIKTSVNERLARFLQDPRQLQIRLPDVEIYEHDSLINLANLYSLQMSLDNGCAVLNKTSNTTQSVNIDQQSLQSRLFLSDFKRRCYESKGSELLRK